MVKAPNILGTAAETLAKESKYLGNPTGNLVQDASKPGGKAAELPEEAKGSGKEVRNLPEYRQSFARRANNSGDPTRNSPEITSPCPRFLADLTEKFSTLPGKSVGLPRKTPNSSGKTLRSGRRNPVFSHQRRATGSPGAHARCMIKLNTGFSDFNADGLGHLGEKVVTNLAKLPVFANVKPTSAEITAAVTALQQAILMTGPGRAEAINAAFDALAGLLADLATNAPQVAGVTDTDLAAIGLPTAKSAVRSTNPPGICQNLRLSHGQNQGEVQGKCDPAGDNIRTYEGQWTLDPNGNTWSEVSIFPNSRSFKFGGLTRGKDVWVRVRARNTIGAGGWSDPATIMVT